MADLTPAARFAPTVGTASGVGDCPCCGVQVMCGNIARPPKCDDCKRNRCARPDGTRVGGFHGE